LGQVAEEISFLTNYRQR